MRRRGWTGWTAGLDMLDDGSWTLDMLDDGSWTGWMTEGERRGIDGGRRTGVDWTAAVDRLDNRTVWQTVRLADRLTIGRTQRRGCIGRLTVDTDPPAEDAVPVSCGT